MDSQMNSSKCLNSKMLALNQINGSGGQRVQKLAHTCVDMNYIKGATAWQKGKYNLSIYSSWSMGYFCEKKWILTSASYHTHKPNLSELQI